MLERFKLRHLGSERREAIQTRKAASRIKKAEEGLHKTRNELEEAMRARSGDKAREAGLEMGKSIRTIAEESQENLEDIYKIVKSQLAHLSAIVDDFRKMQDVPVAWIDEVAQMKVTIEKYLEAHLQDLDRVREGGAPFKAERALDEGSLANDIQTLSRKLTARVSQYQKAEKSGEEAAQEAEQLDTITRNRIENALKKIEKFAEREWNIISQDLGETLLLIADQIKNIEAAHGHLQRIIATGFRHRYAEKIDEHLKKTLQDIKDKFAEREKELRFLIGQTAR